MRSHSAGRRRPGRPARPGRRWPAARTSAARRADPAAGRSAASTTTSASRRRHAFDGGPGLGVVEPLLQAPGDVGQGERPESGHRVAGVAQRRPDAGSRDGSRPPRTGPTRPVRPDRGAPAVRRSVGGGPAPGRRRDRPRRPVAGAQQTEVGQGPGQPGGALGSTLGMQSPAHRGQPLVLVGQAGQDQQVDVERIEIQAGPRPGRRGRRPGRGQIQHRAVHRRRARACPPPTAGRRPTRDRPARAGRPARPGGRPCDGRPGAADGDRSRRGRGLRVGVAVGDGVGSAWPVEDGAGVGPLRLGGSTSRSRIAEPHHHAQPRSVAGVEVQPGPAHGRRHVLQRQVHVDPARVGHHQAVAGAHGRPGARTPRRRPAGRAPSAGAARPPTSRPRPRPRRRASAQAASVSASAAGSSVRRVLARGQPAPHQQGGVVGREAVRVAGQPPAQGLAHGVQDSAQPDGGPRPVEHPGHQPGALDHRRTGTADPPSR